VLVKGQVVFLSTLSVTHPVPHGWRATVRVSEIESFSIGNASIWTRNAVVDYKYK
jgi:hypothetical protein